MTTTQPRFKITYWHGEWKSLFYIIDMSAKDSEQPAVVATFDTRDDAREHADFLEFLNAEGALR